jgi:hypothetical protein
VARRFRCGADLCGRRIFTERFEDGVLVPWARRTGRLDYVIHHLGLALGGRPANARLVSNNKIQLKFRTKDFEGEYFHYTGDLFFIYKSGHLMKLTCQKRET